MPSPFDNLRENSEMGDNVWENHIGDELEFWRGVIAQRAKEGYRPKLHKFEWLRGELGEAFEPHEPLRFIDVGAGPFGIDGVSDPVCGVEAIATDALAEPYNRMMREAGLTAFPEVVQVKGEHLSQHFGCDSFHWVHCANALDHFDSPAVAFAEMLKICKPMGYVNIVSIENEGERENYGGLHQWNLRATDEGLLFGTKSGQTNLTEPHGDAIRYKWKLVDHGQKGFNIFMATIQKLAPISSA
jgi:SAM-dependent methyltransferase